MRSLGITRLKIDFVGKRRLAYALSVAAILISLASLLFRGLNLGIDFTGGAIVEIGFAESAEIPALTHQLERAGIGFSSVQYFGSDRDLVVRIPPQQQIDQANIQTEFANALSGMGPSPPEIRRVEFVGAQVGQELVDQGGIALIISLAGIALYIWMRFERRFAIGALAATLHDPILTLGFFSVTWTEFDLSVLAAVLAVVGYSVNDTIVIFDRIRENFRKVRGATPYEIVNTSVNQTMSRSVITSGTTLMVAIAMLLFGGPQLHGFSLALVIGILVGTYSSIYVASAVALDLGASRQDLMPAEVKPEGDE
jgi:preprotein translocase subunit SecF